MGEVKNWGLVLLTSSSLSELIYIDFRILDLFTSGYFIWVYFFSSSIEYIDSYFLH